MNDLLLTTLWVFAIGGFVILILVLTIILFYYMFKGQ